MRNHPHAEEHGARLLAVWRELGRPVFHVKHNSIEPHSTYRPGQPGNEFKAEFLPWSGEPVTAKRTGSAFVGTPLQALLEAGRHDVLVVFGVITNGGGVIAARWCRGGLCVSASDGWRRARRYSRSTILCGMCDRW